MMLLIAMFAAAQTAQPPLRDPDPRPMRPLDPLEAPAPPLRSSSPEARLANQRFGACIASASTAKASETLNQDFRTTGYRNALRNLADNNRGCFKLRGRMRMSNLSLAGSIAEALLARDLTPLNGRLAAAAGRPVVASFAPSDAAALCVVRSDPDGTARLFATGVASAEEGAALSALSPLMNRCAGRTIEATPDGLRAMLATAAFRSVNGKAN